MNSKVQTFIALQTSKLSVHATATVRDPHELHAVEEVTHHALVAETTTTATIVVALATMTPSIVVGHHLVMLIPMAVAVAAAADMTIVIVAMAVLLAEAHHLDATMHTDHHVADTRNHMVRREGMIALKI